MNESPQPNAPTTIPFRGDDLLLVDVDGEQHIVLKPAFEAIGIGADQQIANLKAQVWATTSVTPVVAGDGKVRNMMTADIRSFLMHLATIPASRVAEHVRPKLVDYQCEVAKVIEQHFRGERHDPTVPNTVTWAELAALIRQRYGIDLEVAEITRGLRDAGVLRQDGGPKKAFRGWLWFTGSAWTVHPHMLPELTRKLVDTRRALGDLQSQMQLDLALDEQLRWEMGSARARIERANPRTPIDGREKERHHRPRIAMGPDNGAGTRGIDNRAEAGRGEVN